MNPMLFGKKFDLVDFEDVKLLMFQNDNLYRVSVPDGRKNKSLRDYSLAVAKLGYPKSVVTPENVHQLKSARYGLFIYLNHLWEMNIEFDARISNGVIPIPKKHKKQFSKLNKVHVVVTAEREAVDPKGENLIDYLIKHPLPYRGPLLKRDEIYDRKL